MKYGQIKASVHTKRKHETIIILSERKARIDYGGRKTK